MVKFLDLQSQYQRIKHEIDAVVLEVIARGAFIGGEYVERFEGEFARRVGSKYALSVGNGTDAIELAFRALEIPQGSEVILPVNTFFGSLEGVVNAGLKPVFVDCGEDYCINVAKIEEAITPNTRAILPVHLYGRMCDMGAILKIAKGYGLKVVEDCAQSFGAKVRVNGEVKVAGGIGDVGCFSFYPGKNLGAYGDGGAISTNDIQVYALASSLANHGRGKDKYEHLYIGRNSRLDGIQAGVLSVKLQYIDSWNERRRECAKLYNDVLDDLQDFLILPKIDEWERSVWHLYVVRLIDKIKGKRDELMGFLKDKRIECGIHYPYPLSEGFKSWGSQILSLPMGEHLRDEDIFEIARAVREFVRLC